MDHANGTPAWIDLITLDRPAAQMFYGAVFGWTFEDQIIDNAVVYVLARHNQREAAGIAARSPEEVALGIPSAWNLFFATDDIDKTCAHAASLGATVHTPPFGNPAVGKLAVLTDPTGALFCLWQGNAHLGMTTKHAPGTYTWCECLTRDPERTTRFYEDLFGWKTEVSHASSNEYFLCQRDGEAIAGIMTMPDGLEGVPANWMVYFAASDCVATIDRIEQHGGSLLNGPMEVGTGRFAVVTDPNEAVFGIIEPLG